MISIPKVVLLILIETILVLAVGMAFVWWRARKLRPATTTSTSDETGPLLERIKALETERDEAIKKAELAAAVQPPAPAEETSLKEISIAGEIEEKAPESPPESAGSPEGEAPLVDEQGRTLDDILLILSLQVKILREQEGVLSSIFKGFEGAGPEQVQEQLALLMEMHFNYDSALGTLEAELQNVKKLSGRGGGSSEELEEYRQKVASLEAEVEKSRQEIKSLEHEYDILYSKTAASEAENQP